jgi:hypothetical protein
VVSSGHAKLSRLPFLIPGSLVRVQPGVLRSTGNPALFSFQVMGSFVAPASILKNPQICAGTSASGRERAGTRPPPKVQRAPS